MTIITKDLILFRNLKINKVSPFELKYTTLLITIDKKKKTKIQLKNHTVLEKTRNTKVFFKKDSPVVTLTLTIEWQCLV